MRKKKLFTGIFLGMVVFSLIVGVFVKITKAHENTSTTFPVNEAGISAYIKTDTELTVNHLSKAGDEVSKQGSTYVIVKVKNLGGIDNSPVFVYIGLDGWIVSYYLKGEPASKMIIFLEKDQPIQTTLEKAIEKVCNQMGIDCSSSLLNLKYYNFEFPDANKLTLVGELTAPGYSNQRTNDFFVTVPGTIFQASYTMKASIWTTGWCWKATKAQFSLKVDATTVVEGMFQPDLVISGLFDVNTYFQANVTHHIIFSSLSECTHDLIGNVALIYRN